MYDGLPTITVPVYQRIPACNMRTSKRIWCMLMILKKNKCHTVRFACDDSSVVLVSEEVWHLFPHDVNLFVRVILVFISFMTYTWLGPCLSIYSSGLVHPLACHLASHLSSLTCLCMHMHAYVCVSISRQCFNARHISSTTFPAIFDRRGRTSVTTRGRCVYRNKGGCLAVFLFLWCI